MLEQRRGEVDATSQLVSSPLFCWIRYSESDHTTDKTSICYQGTAAGVAMSDSDSAIVGQRRGVGTKRRALLLLEDGKNVGIERITTNSGSLAPMA